MIKRKYLKLFLLLIFLIVIDQLIKNVLYFQYPKLIYLNKGIIFGQISNIYLIWLILIIGIGLLIYLINRKIIIFDWFVVLVSAGAISNIIDRLSHEGVLDYINLANITIFNLADVYIVAAIAVFLIRLMPNKKQTH